MSMGEFWGIHFQVAASTISMLTVLYHHDIMRFGRMMQIRVKEPLLHSLFLFMRKPKLGREEEEKEEEEKGERRPHLSPPSPPLFLSSVPSRLSN